MHGARGAAGAGIFCPMVRAMVRDVLPLDPAHCGDGERHRSDGATVHRSAYRLGRNFGDRERNRAAEYRLPAGDFGAGKIVMAGATKTTPELIEINK